MNITYLVDIYELMVYYINIDTNKSMQLNQNTKDNYLAQDSEDLIRHAKYTGTSEYWIAVAKFCQDELDLREETAPTYFRLLGTY